MTELQIFTRKILISLGIFGACFFLYTYREPFFLFFGSFLLVFFSYPFLNQAKQRNLPNWFGILSFYSFFLFFLFILVSSVLPIFVGQITSGTLFLKDFIQSFQDAQLTPEEAIIRLLPEGLEQFISKDILGNIALFISQNIASIATYFAQFTTFFAKNATGFITQTLGQILQFTLVVIGSFLILLEKDTILGVCKKHIAPKYWEKLSTIFYLSQDSLLSWYKAQSILALAIFSITFLGLWVLSFFWPIQSIFSLALIAGLMEFIPYIGPFIALIPALFASLGFGPEAFFAVFFLYIGIQQIENNFLVPYVMGKNLDISPFLVFFGMIFGASFGGILGMILSLPLIATLKSWYTIIYLPSLLNQKKK